MPPEVPWVHTRDPYAHQVVDHACQYVDGRVHTNGLENFWSLLKRGISGTYVSVEPFHLFRYLDDQAYRFNNRKKPMDDSARYYDLLSRLSGKRITYSEVTGAGQLYFCAPESRYAEARLVFRC